MELKEWPTRQIALLVFPGVHLMGLAGPLEVFTRASTTLSNIGQRRSAAYQVQVLTEEETPLPTGSGLSVIGGVRWTKADKPIDTLFVLASTNVIDSQINPELLAWIRTQAETIRRVGAVSAGAFVLAAAGILDGRQVTTHWDMAATLAKRYPKIMVDGDRIFTRDGNIWTSAGVSTGVDLALAMVEEDHGHALAMDIARRMILFMRRSAGQRQFSSQLAAQTAERQPIRELIAWMSEHLDADLSVHALARRVGMSERNFSRVFKRQVDTTPARFVARVRTEAARAKLAEAPEKLEVVAQSAGFGDGETLRRHLRDESKEALPPEQIRARIVS